MRKSSGEGGIAGKLLELQDLIYSGTLQGIVSHGGSKFSELYRLYLLGCFITVIMQFLEVLEAKILHNALEDSSSLDLCEASEDSPSGMYQTRVSWWNLV